MPSYGRKGAGPLVRDLHSIAEEVEGKSVTAVDALQFVSKDLIERLDKVSALINVEEEEKKDRVGVVEEDIATHQLKEVVSALEEHNKVPVDAFEVQELRKLERECTTERAKKRQRLNAEVQEKVNEKVRFLELQFAKEYAKSEAQEQAFAEERKTLTETIEQLRAAIRDQKRLTGDLAVAAAQPPPINVVRGN
eukprot:Rhum_TRINITY_DN14639_c3_g4::Rhum_TRINITY_DN14639_c3_g4_i1::g.106709::m.106709